LELLISLPQRILIVAGVLINITVKCIPEKNIQLNSEVNKPGVVLTVGKAYKFLPA